MVKQQFITCSRCGEVCFGETIRAYSKHFHIYCFSCEVVGCAHDLLKDGFFVVNGGIYCRKDYHKLMGKRCTGCKKYVEGEVISALEHLYHPHCFRCATCSNVFPPNTEICYDGNDFFCKCKACLPPSDNASRTLQSTNSTSSVVDTKRVANICTACNNEIKSGQAILACEKQWHVRCFKCHTCQCLLVGNYLAHDGKPYCEKDYHDNFGLICDYCGDFITGKVLQAGEKCYHPQCSRCAMCGEIFQEGEEMYLQGSQIWHPRCNKASQHVRAGRGNEMEDTDRSLDSTMPATENYDASRSFNDCSDFGDLDDLSSIPIVKTHTVTRHGFPASDLIYSTSNGVEKEIISAQKSATAVPFNSNQNILWKLHKRSSDAAIMLDDALTNFASRQCNTQEDFPREFYKYLTTTDRRHVNRILQGSPASPNSPRDVNSLNSNSPRPGSSPGSFRSVHSPNGQRGVNSPNGFLPVNSSSNRSLSSPSNFYTSSPKGFRSTSSPRGSSTLCNTPPYNDEEEDIPPPIPPPPTRRSSRNWQQKYSQGANSQRLRRSSFSKAVSATADENRSSSLTDSDTFASSCVTSDSTDELDELSQKIALLQMETDQLLQKKKDFAASLEIDCLTSYA